MKINDFSSQSNAPTLGEEQFFSIQDQGMIFDILRNKMYSDPIMAICREITCNARDAHREVGKADVPIHIFLPNSGEPFFKVKDYGPGISPDRISNIYIKYTASTKRADNVQTGGFGLGAKTPFSYSDTFNILTTYNGKQYNYVCFIDDTKVGKIVLVSEEDTKDENGTEIIVPVQSKDFSYFVNCFERAVRHWDVKPIVKGNVVIYNKVGNEILAGDNWKISSTFDQNYGYKTIKLIIDGIEYPLDMSSIRDTSNKFSIINGLKGNLYLYFNVGELSLSANREQIYFDANTKKKLEERFSLISKEIKETTQTKIDSCSNLKDAIVFCRRSLLEALSDLSFLGSLEWKGISILPSTKHNFVGCTVYSFRKGNRYGYGDKTRISRSITQSIVFEENTELYINDLKIKDPVVKHIKKAFEDNPNLNSLQLIEPNDSVSLETLNEKYYLDKMGAKLVSDLTKYSSRNKKSSANRLIVYRYDNIIKGFKQVSYSHIDEDNNKKILCLFNKEFNSDKNILIGESYYPVSIFRHKLNLIYEDFDNYSIYAIDSSIPKSRIAEDFEDFEDFTEFLNSKILNKPRSYYASIKSRKETVGVDENFIQSFSPFIDKIINPKSVFLKKLNIQMDASKISKKESNELSLYETIHGTISDEELVDLYSSKLSKIESEYSLTYPLIQEMYYYRINTIIPHIIEYVNFIDSKTK